MSEDSYKEFYQPRKVTPIKVTEISKDPSQRSPFKERPVFASSSANFSQERKKPFLEKVGLRKPKEVKDSYAKVSIEHGRALVDTRINRNVVWGDEYGILFGSKDWKGAIMNNVSVTTDRYSPYGMRTEGLKDNVGLQRIHVVSELLRQNGLPTELPVSTHKVEEIIEYNRKIPVEEWKRNYVEMYQREVERLKSGGDAQELARNQDFLERLEDYFSSTDFYVVERDLQVAERLRDITHARSAEEFEEVVKPVFKWVNAATAAKKDGIIADTGYAGEFSFDEAGIKRYFGEWLPKQMGVYLARMHKLGLAHGYPHAQNWSVAGTLYDLDSVHGSPLGDPSATEEDFALDTKKTLEALAEISDNSYEYLPSIYRGFMTDAHASFVIAYTKERFGENLDSERLDDVRRNYFDNYKAVTDYTFPPLGVDVWNRVADRFQKDSVSIPSATQTQVEQV